MPIELNDNKTLGIAQNEDAPTNEARAKRHRPKRGLGSAITRKRRLQAEAIGKQIEERKASERNAARNEIERLRARSKDTQVRDNWASNLLRGTVNDQVAFMRSIGLNHPVHASLTATPHVVAWTDFTKVVVNWPTKSMPNRYDRNDVLDTIAQIKGVMQHEVGHIRFTTPWVDVLANTSQKNKSLDEGLLHKCWNMLEDERMESLVVEAVPRIKNYFGTMVLNVVLNKGDVPAEQVWLMLAGREYFPQDVLKKSYELFDQWTFDLGIKNGADTWYNLVQDYKAADSHKKIMRAVEAALEFILKVQAVMPQLDDHDPQKSKGQDPNDTARPGGSIMDLFNKNKPQKADKNSEKEWGKGQTGEGDPNGGGGEDGDGEGDGNGPISHRENYEDRPADGGRTKGKGKGDKGEEGDSEGEGSGGEGGKGKKDPSSLPKAPQQSNTGEGMNETVIDADDLMDALSDLKDEYQSMLRGDKDNQAIARGANSESDRDGLPLYNEGHEGPMPEDLRQRAVFTAMGIERALNSFVTASEPIWQNRKDVGIIDPLAYRTKGVGDRDFRRHLDDHGNMGLDVHVSMLCDVSGSMGGWYGQSGGTAPIVALSESIYATALACQSLGIGSTYTLWSSGNQNYRVWSDGNPVPTLWPSMGGTDPTIALDDLDTHNPEEAANHLVVIFTDGAWAHNFPSIQRWTAPGRTFVLVRYGSYEGAMQVDMGADRHIQINNVDQLPGELTKALVDVLADSMGR